ncbi:uroporphyrinogen-III synthase [Rhodococcus jostii]|uniref:uroporphyrinogen-III synthase n=1 Tax=Rhodococcus jostii TaxID=132919 RepID=UPI0009354CB7|nr:uroporphyrinogen-III synthase [Rhodococcus jostii]
MDDAKPLTGFTIGVTASRRADEFATFLTRRGATVIHAPAIRIIPLSDDTELRRVTRQIIDKPPEFVVVTTGIGFRGWMEAAAGWGERNAFKQALASTRLLARGTKAKGAVRAAELCEEWSPVSETMAEVLDHLVAQGIDGKRIAVQLDGAPTEGKVVGDLCDLLGCAGADVTAVPVYRWMPPEDPAPIDRMIDLIATRALDAVSFTSAPAVGALLARAKVTGTLEPILHAFRNDVLAACIGPVTSVPFIELEVPTTGPECPRLGELVWHIADELPRRAITIQVGGREFSIRGSCVLVDGEVRRLPPAAMTLIRVLGAQPGRVVPREELMSALPRGGDAHAVEVAVARLRASLRAPDAVQTVYKRGYRLALDPVEYVDMCRDGTV